MGIWDSDNPTDEEILDFHNRNLVAFGDTGRLRATKVIRGKMVTLPDGTQYREADTIEYTSEQ